MDKIGVGDCQAHVSHWLENRIRNLRRDVQARGGSIAGQDIEASLCEHVRSGRVEGLSYDEASGRVYLSSRLLPQGQPFPPVPATAREALQFLYPYRAGPGMGWQMPLGPHAQFLRFHQPERPEGVGEFAKATCYPNGAGYGPGVTTMYPHCMPPGFAASAGRATPAVGGDVGAAGWMPNPAAHLHAGVDMRRRCVEPPQGLGQRHDAGVSTSGGKTHVTDGTAPSISEQPAGGDQSAESRGDSSECLKDQGDVKILSGGDTPGADERPFDAAVEGAGENRVHPALYGSKHRPQDFQLPSQTRLGQPEQTADAPSINLQGNAQENASAVGGLENLSPRSGMPQAVKATVHGHAKSSDTAADAVKLGDAFLPTGRVLPASNATADQSSKDASTRAAVSSGMPPSGEAITSETVNTAVNLGCTGSEATPSPSAGRTAAKFLIIHDGPSMAKATTALGVTGGKQDDAGHLSRAFGGAEPVAVRVLESGVEGENDAVSTVQIAGKFSRVLVFDVQSLLRAPGGPAILNTELVSLLGDERIRKVMHDVHDHAVALACLFQAPSFRIKSVVDMQVVHEALTAHPLNSFTECLSCFGLCDDRSIMLSMEGGVSVKRPLSGSTLQLAADSVLRLRKAFLLVQGTVVGEEQLDTCFRASQMRADYAVDTKRSGWRRMIFADENVTDDGTPVRYLASYELLMLSRIRDQDTQEEAQTPLGPLESPMTSENARCGLCPPSRRDHTDPIGRHGQEKGAFRPNLWSRHNSGVSKSDRGGSDPGDERRSFGDSKGLADNDILEMLNCLPKVFVEGLLAGRDHGIISGLEEVVLDQGTRPRALVRGRGRVYLCDDEDVLVTRYHISCVVGRLESEGLLAAEDRTGFDGLLHRVGVIRDTNGIIFGVTIRVRRFVKGCAEVLGDILLNANPGDRRCRAPSILVLGGHKSGKTTLVRDMCRKLSATENVVIVDTRNDIGGDGLVPHREAIGESRRLMVPSETTQHRVMYRALRDHSPRTLAVDEISSPEDIEACRILQARGVRVIAGAVGDLPSTLDSLLLGAALGGLVPVESSSCGDDPEQERRADKPMFDVVVELEGGNQPAWSVVTAVATVVDELLEKGCVCKSEIRAPLPSTENNILDLSRGNTCTGFLLKVTQDSSDVWMW